MSRGGGFFGRRGLRAHPSAMLAIAFAVALAALPGCAKKKTAGESAYDQSGGTMAEGTVPGGSLDQFKRGTLGSDQQGPLQDVHFAYDSFELTDNARELLRTNADWLRDNPNAKVEVEGHTDSRGTVEYNLALGAKRATAVRDYLVSLGVSASRVTTISYGKELPLCHEETESCWAENRRAHFVVLS
ncbi:MAG TPA: peptidoglycan-associated lipoprotein Pal [Candidatus Binatia bacterium]|nr:peptidoglycan-associated lipoprotein Pal [Candidatus Binatia bacterium]